MIRFRNIFAIATVFMIVISYGIYTRVKNLGHPDTFITVPSTPNNKNDKDTKTGATPLTTESIVSIRAEAHSATASPAEKWQPKEPRHINQEAQEAFTVFTRNFTEEDWLELESATNERVSDIFDMAASGEALEAWDSLPDHLQIKTLESTAVTVAAEMQAQNTFSSPIVITAPATGDVIEF
jgi:hypothetical protein